MSSVVRIVKRGEREAENTRKAADNPRAVQPGTSEIAGVVKGWIAACRDRRRAQESECRQLYKRSKENRNPTHGQILIAEMILSAIILTACSAGTGIASVAGKSQAGDLAKLPALYSMLKWQPADQHFVTVESLRVHYIETGTGRTVVLLHGNAGGVEDFEFGAIELLSSDYRVIAIDRPGHGSSDRPTRRAATIEYQAELLHRTLSNLGITQPILVGHSWGGALALAYVLKYPDEVSAMVLLAPAAYPDNGGNGLLRTMIRTPFVGDLSLLLGKPIVGPRLLKRALAQAFFPQTMPDSYFKIARSLWLGRKQLKAYIEDEWALNESLREMSKRYSGIKLPVVIFTGDKDKIVSPQENAYCLHAAIPQSRLIELKDTGHEIPQTHPESIVAGLMLIVPSTASMRVHPAEN
jgi:pimeloyl-ACP methyl ester carboxylesterase